MTSTFDIIWDYSASIQATLYVLALLRHFPVSHGVCKLELIGGETDL